MRKPHWRNPGFEQTEGEPVVCVSFEDAQAYAAWLTVLTGEAYRLPSEAEWEYAARAGATTAYAFGDEITREQANFGSEIGKTTPPGSYPANPLGLYDMHGNVWEWVQDCWHESYGGAPSDGSAWEDTQCSGRVVRGGSWFETSDNVRSAVRRSGEPFLRGILGPLQRGPSDEVLVRSSASLGFRVARELTVEAVAELGVSGYRLAPGDRIRVTVFRQADLSGEFDLDGEGFLALPLVGEIQGAGLTARELESSIESRLKDGGSLVNPQVSVEVLNYRPFYIIGEVNNPGSYQYVNGMTVINAVALAGGFTYRADQDDIIITRGGSSGRNLQAQPDSEVLPGDVIEVTERFF